VNPSAAEPIAIEGPWAFPERQPQSQPLAEQVAARVFRRDLSQPGFAVIDLGPSVSPRQLREVMTALTKELSEVYQRDFGGPLTFQFMGRFDQQVTTRPHRDGGPRESVLMLGYEPTTVASRLFILDHTRWAVALGLTPEEFLGRFNPMSSDPKGMDKYTTEVQGLDGRHSQILLINNSTLPYDQRHAGTQGVLHQATILSPDANQTRYVNSLLLTPGDPAVPAEPLGEKMRAFLDLESLRR
jgi:hypothetical protein